MIRKFSASRRLLQFLNRLKLETFAPFAAQPKPTKHEKHR
jgi:hypothetical protein